MSTKDNRRLCNLVEQMQQDENVVDLEGKLYIMSADQTGEIGVAGKYDAEKWIWVQPMEVFGVEEPLGAQHKYTAKTREMLDMFASEESSHHRNLRALAGMIARDVHVSQTTHSDKRFESEWYYNIKRGIFHSNKDSWEGSQYFRGIMFLYKGKSVD